MSLQGEVRGLQGNLQGEIKNNNKQPLLAPADANANQLPTQETHAEERGTEHGSPLPPLVSQSQAKDRIIIWGTHTQCNDPELEEFELLECQELNAFLVPDEREDYRRGRGEKATKVRQPAAVSAGPAPGHATKDDNDNHNVGERPQTQALDLRTTASHSGQRRGLRESRSGSESNVFVSCLSTVSNLSGSLASALDSAGHSLSLSSQSVHPTSAKGRTLQPAAYVSLIPSKRSQEQPGDVDQNHNHNSTNSTTMAQEPGPLQPQPDRSLPLKRGPCLNNGYGKCPAPNREVTKEQRLNQVPLRTAWEQERQGNGVSSELKRSLDERVPPCRRQLVRPLSPETEEAQAGRRLSHSSETPAYKVNSQQVACKELSETHSYHLSSSSGLGAEPGQSSGMEAQALRRQGSGERAASPSSLERRAQMSRRPWGSPSRAPTPPSPRKPPPASPVKNTGARAPLPGYGGAPQGYVSGLRAPVRTSVTSSIPKPLLQHPPSERSPPPKCPLKPKSVRPKIITYIRKSPQVKPQAAASPYEVSSLPSRLSAYASAQGPGDPRVGGDSRSAPVLSASNLLYDKYRQEMQKAHLFSPPGLAVSGIKPPSHTIPHKLPSRADSFYGSLSNKYLPAGMGRAPASLGGNGPEDPSGPHMGVHDAGGLFRPPRPLRPQLGLGAVNRSPSAANKNRMFLTGQRSPLAFCQPVQAVNPTTQSPTVNPTQSPVVNPTTQSLQDPAAEQRRCGLGVASRSQLSRQAASSLRPPGFSSRLPPARLAAFGFVRSSSVSSVSSNHSTHSTCSDPCRPNSVNDEPPLHRITTATCDAPHAPCRSSPPQPPNTPALTRRALLPPPRGSPGASRKEFQKSCEVSRPALSSPKRLAVVSPKPQSPVLQRPRAAVSAVSARAPGLDGSLRRGGRPGPEKEKEKEKEQEQEQREQEKEVRGEEVLRLQGHCDEQARQLQVLRAQLRKTTLGLEALAVCTQHLCMKSEDAVEKERELSLELGRIREEVASSTAQWEGLQRERAELELSFQQELQQLQGQQEAELAAVEEGLRAHHSADRDHLREEHQSEMEEMHTHQQDQIVEMTVNHESAMEDLKTMHNITMATLQEEHTRTMRDLRKSHEQQKTSLEVDFEMLRLSLQDQVDTLTFQNRSLRDKAKRFEEALRRSTDEQIVDVLSPYQHIEEDLRSLKDVLEMKNQQIHHQEKKISELEKMAQKNVLLEERLQVLQQQNEDLKARIDRNLALSRQLSEENASLQGHVEKESNEKKRLSRNNEELLWRLQTGELSPRMSPSSSPNHRAFFPGPDIPPYPYSPGPGTPTHSSSPGPATPTHRAVSPGLGTSTLMGSPARACPVHLPNANTLPP